MEIRVNFIYNERIIPILSKSDEEMVKVIRKFIANLNPESNINDYEYYYNQKEIGVQSNLGENLNIKDSSTKEVTIYVKRRIWFCKCPVCICNDCTINLSNYLCAFHGCKYAHEVITVYDNYKVRQTIDYSEIRCSAPECEKNLGNDVYDFYKCLECSKLAKKSKYFCSQCKAKHKKKDHNFIKYDEKHYYCDAHLKPFEKSCLTCKKDLCKSCEAEHSGHEIANYAEMETNVDDLNTSLKKIKDHIETLEEVIENIKYHLDGTKRIYERYYNISLDILKKYETFNKKLKNYRILRTIRNLKLSNKQIIGDLEKIINIDDLKSQCSTIIELYQNKVKRYEGATNLTIKDVEKENNEIWYQEIQKNTGTKIKKKQNEENQKHKISNKK